MTDEPVDTTGPQHVTITVMISGPELDLRKLLERDRPRVFEDQGR